MRHVPLRWANMSLMWTVGGDAIAHSMASMRHVHTCPLRIPLAALPCTMCPSRPSLAAMPSSAALPCTTCAPWPPSAAIFCHLQRLKSPLAAISSSILEPRHHRHFAHIYLYPQRLCAGLHIGKTRYHTASTAPQHPRAMYTLCR